MIIEWILSCFLLWFFPAAISSFNPFYLPIASNILKRKPLIAAISAYCTGVIRDIFLATPRFGLLGMSSLFSCFIAQALAFYFPLEGLLGSLVLTTVLSLSDVLLTAFLGSFLCGQFFFSWRALFFALLFSAVWTISIKIVPLATRSFLLRRRRRATDS